MNQSKILWSVQSQYINIKFFGWDIESLSVLPNSLIIAISPLTVLIWSAVARARTPAALLLITRTPILSSPLVVVRIWSSVVRTPLEKKKKKKFSYYNSARIFINYNKLPIPPLWTPGRLTHHTNKTRPESDNLAIWISVYKVYWSLCRWLHGWGILADIS